MWRNISHESNSICYLESVETAFVEHGSTQCLGEKDSYEVKIWYENGRWGGVGGGGGGGGVVW